jgi:hypothetical protein
LATDKGAAEPGNPEVPQDQGQELTSVLAALTGLVQDLTAKVETLQHKVDNTAPQGPQYIPMGRADETPAEVLARITGGRVEGLLGPQRPQMVNGKMLTKQMLDVTSPRFKVGDIVRIDPAAERHGTNETWADVLHSGNSDGTGLVKRLEYLGGNLEWKYRIHVPGVTKPHGDGFRDHEILERIA